MVISRKCYNWGQLCRRLTQKEGQSCFQCDVKESLVVRGHQGELNPTLLFMRMTCVITDRDEMTKNLE